MELAIAQEDANVLLKDKNNLNESILEKYRLAGQVSQTCLTYILSLIRDSYHLGKHAPYTVQELCLLGDSYLKSALEGVYKRGSKAVRERGIAQPVTIECNEIVSGFAPEFDDPSNYIFQVGDIVSITLGAQIDGYTANASHTVVIYPSGEGITKPSGPLVGVKADAVCAAHIATEAVLALLGASLTPEKLPKDLNVFNNTVVGQQIRNVVDSVADSFGCVVVPGSRVRRIRRFLAGQAEGVVAEKEYKGVAWSEIDQELQLLNRSKNLANQELVKFDKTKNITVSSDSAIPTDEFVVIPGEVYAIDIKMASIAEFPEAGLITLETVDELTGANHNTSQFRSKPTVFIRDFAITHQLKLRGARQLLGKIDKNCSVYPFKLAHLAENFPINIKSTENIDEQLNSIKAEIKSARLGLSELTNRHLAVARPIQVAKFLPLQVILNAANPTGTAGFDADKPTLPGMELPLPRLGISSLKLKALLKGASTSVPVAREMTTVVLIAADTQANGAAEVLRLTGGSKTSSPSWVHSENELNGPLKESIQQLLALGQDKRFGIKIRECQAFKLEEGAEGMQLD